ncbi:MAG: hypothetical protein AAGB48_03460 [Planctomycetota bacterium]
MSGLLAATGPALPLWLVAPPAFLLMLFLAAYVLALREADVPESRRRIRTTASIVMMALQPLLVYLFAIGSAQTPRPFVFTWVLVMGLVGTLVILALLDVLNNAKLATQKRQELREEFRKLRKEIDAFHRERRDAEPTGAGPELRLTGTDDAEPAEDGRG